jgi:predicted nucleic acid-binding protein
VSDDIRATAWQIFVRYDDQLFSFTDCTSFALMRSLGIGDAFTFDRRDYLAAGFVPLP